MKNTNPDDELYDLICDEKGKLANRAADASLQLLALLGGMNGPATPEYRQEVARALVRVLLCTTAVRSCIEAANPDMTPGQLLGFLSRLVAASFALDPEPVIRELVGESLDY